MGILVQLLLHRDDVTLMQLQMVQWINFQISILAFSMINYNYTIHVFSKNIWTISWYITLCILIWTIFVLKCELIALFCMYALQFKELKNNQASIKMQLPATNHWNHTPCLNNGGGGSWWLSISSSSLLAKRWPPFSGGSTTMKVVTANGWPHLSNLQAFQSSSFHFFSSLHPLLPPPLPVPPSLRLHSYTSL